MTRWRQAQRAAADLPGPVRGALWMVAAGMAFACMMSTLKPLAAELHPFEIAFFRNLVVVGFMMPWLVRAGFGVLRTDKLWLFGLRAVTGLGAALAWHWAVPLLALADAVALNFTAPLFATVLAALILRERVRLRRWTATLLGFAGVLIVLRPGFETLSVAALVLIASTAAWGSQQIVLKVLSRTEGVNVIVSYYALLLTPLTFIPALLVWRTPGLETMAWLIALGGFGTLGHICLTRAFAAADASVVLPFDFAKLPLAALSGFVLFGESPDHWTLVGAAVIVGSNVYIARREAQVARAEEKAAAALALRTDRPGTA